MIIYRFIIGKHLKIIFISHRFFTLFINMTDLGLSDED